MERDVLEQLPDIDRFFRPRSVAVVGATESRRFPGHGSVLSLLEQNDADVFFIHPTATTMFGRPAFASLVDAGKPVDAVFSLVSAERTIEVVGQARAVGAGGVVIIAAGFGEAGEAGGARQAGAA